MKITVDEQLVDRIARLSELALKEEEQIQAKEDMTDMLAFLDRLDLADLSGVEPLYQVLPQENVLREDAVTSQPDGGEDKTMPAWLAENAPECRERYFAVPRTI